MQNIHMVSYLVEVGSIKLPPIDFFTQVYFGNCNFCFNVNISCGTFVKC